MEGIHEVTLRGGGVCGAILLDVELCRGTRVDVGICTGAQVEVNICEEAWMVDVQGEIG